MTHRNWFLHWHICAFVRVNVQACPRGERRDWDWAGTSQRWEDYLMMSSVIVSYIFPFSIFSLLIITAYMTWTGLFVCMCWFWAQKHTRDYIASDTCCLLTTWCILYTKMATEFKSEYLVQLFPFFPLFFSFLFSFLSFLFSFLFFLFFSFLFFLFFSFFSFPFLFFSFLFFPGQNKLQGFIVMKDLNILLELLRLKWCF